MYKISVLFCLAGLFFSNRFSKQIWLLFKLSAFHVFWSGKFFQNSRCGILQVSADHVMPRRDAELEYQAQYFAFTPLGFSDAGEFGQLLVFVSVLAKPLWVEF